MQCSCHAQACHHHPLPYYRCATYVTHVGCVPEAKAYWLARRQSFAFCCFAGLQCEMHISGLVKENGKESSSLPCKQSNKGTVHLQPSNARTPQADADCARTSSLRLAQAYGRLKNLLELLCLLLALPFCLLLGV